MPESFQGKFIFGLKALGGFIFGFFREIREFWGDFGLLKFLAEERNFYKEAVMCYIMVYTPGTKKAARYQQIVDIIKEEGLYGRHCLTEKGIIIMQNRFHSLEGIMDNLLALISPLSSGKDTLHYNLTCYLWHLLSPDNKDILRNSAERAQLPVAVFPMLAGYYMIEKSVKREPTRSYVA